MTDLVAAVGFKPTNLRVKAGYLRSLGQAASFFHVLLSASNLLELPKPPVTEFLLHAMPKLVGFAHQTTGSAVLGALTLMICHDFALS